MDACVPSEHRPQCSLCARFRTEKWLAEERKALEVVTNASLFIRFAGTCPFLVPRESIMPLQVLDAVCGEAAVSASKAMVAA